VPTLAQSTGSSGYLATVTVPKTCVIAYSAGRGKQVLNPG
jgi:hypothetical protein